MKHLLAILAVSACAEAAAQELFKCKDAAGKITYSSKECSQLGLNPGGEITGRVTVAPAIKVPPQAPAAKGAASKDSAKDASKDAAKGATKDAEASAAAAKDPEKRCFTVKTAKGTSTRCNDVPE